MKRIKMLLLLMSIFILFPVVVRAEENSVKINAPQMVSKGTEITIDIVLSSDAAVDGFKGIFTYETTVLELLNYELKDGWKSAGTISKESPVSFDFNHENGKIGSSTVVTVKF